MKRKIKDFIIYSFLAILKKFASLLGERNEYLFWKCLHFQSLQALNYGDHIHSGSFSKSGEQLVLDRIHEHYDKNKELIIFDVGANTGGYANLLFKNFGARAIIHSFEPSKKTYEQFLETTKNIPTIIPNNIGLSNAEGQQILYTNSDSSGLASVYQRNLEHFGISMDINEDIKLSTLDLYCQKNKIQHIHFLKLDIEGHELKALEGAKQMIDNKNIDFIQFEFGGCNIDSKTYFQNFYYLLKDNYRIYRVLKTHLHEIIRYKELYEVFITTNYLAIKK